MAGITLFLIDFVILGLGYLAAAFGEKRALHDYIAGTGGWGYVADPRSKCWGQIFVDCSHKDTKGKFWTEY